MISPILFTSILSLVAAQTVNTVTGPKPSSSSLSSGPFLANNGTKVSDIVGTAGASGTGVKGTGVMGTAISTRTTAGSTATPSNPIGNYFQLPAIPSSCTGSVIPVKTSIAANGSYFTLGDRESSPFWFGGGSNSVWTISTNSSGIAFGNPTTDQPNVNKVDYLPRKSGNTFTANLTNLNGDHRVMFTIFASNSTEMPPASEWNATKPMPAVAHSNPVYWLNIDGSIPCANPLPVNQSCAAGNLQLNKANWMAYQVDDWLANWVKGAGPFSNSSSMMHKFSDQFMNNNCKPCTYDESCSCSGSCAGQLPNGGKDKDAEKIWLAWNAMENLSDMVHSVWQSVVLNDANALGNIGNIGLDFIDQEIAVTQGSAPEDKISAFNHILGAISPWLTNLAPLVFPEATIGKTVFNIAMGFTGAMLTVADKPGSAPITAQTEGLNTLMKTQGGLANYMQKLESSIENLHNEIFTNGVNITDYLKEGAVANRSLLALDCDSCKQASQAWVMQYLSFKTLDYVWWAQNVFISYMPYGTVISNENGEQTQLTEDICAGVFLKNDPDLIWCHTDDAVKGTSLKPGMARLTYYDKIASGNSPQHPNPQTSEIDKHSNGRLNMTTAAPGIKSKMQFSTASPNVKYTFNKTDIMASSIAGFAKFGFNGDGLSDAASTIQRMITRGDLQGQADQYKAMSGVSASSPGMFTLPVCVSYNLNYWPTIYATDGKPNGDQWCVCNSPWSKDIHGNQFNSSTPADLTTLVSQAYNIGAQMYCAPGIWGSKAPGLTQKEMSPTVGQPSW